MQLGPGDRRYTVLVGDIHGCFDELWGLVTTVARNYGPDQVRLIFLGDLIDRGPLQVAVLRLVWRLVRGGWGFEAYALLGNHEDKHLLYHKREQRRVLDGTPNLMKFHEQQQADHAALATIDFECFGKLPTYLRFEVAGESWLATHAGVPTDKPIEEQAPDKLIRTRFVKKATGKYTSGKNPFECPADAEPWYLRWRGPEHVVFGHSVVGFTDPQIHTNPDTAARCYGLDTGCVYGGRLTALVLDAAGGDPKFLQVQAAKAYVPFHGVE